MIVLQASTQHNSWEVEVEVELVVEMEVALEEEVALVDVINRRDGTWSTALWAAWDTAEAIDLDISSDIVCEFPVSETEIVMCHMYWHLSCIQLNHNLFGYSGYHSHAPLDDFFPIWKTKGAFLWGDPNSDQWSKICLDLSGSWCIKGTGESTLVMDSPVS